MKSGGRLAGVLLLLAGGSFLLIELGGLPDPSFLKQSDLWPLDLDGAGFAASLAKAALSLWPLLLVAAGAAILFRPGRAGRTVWVLILAAIALYALTGPALMEKAAAILERTGFSAVTDGWPFSDKDDLPEGGAIPAAHVQTIALSPDMRSGRADIRLGACDLRVEAAADEAAVISSGLEGIRSDARQEDDILQLTIAEEDVLGSLFAGGRTTHIALGEQLAWEIALETGASDTTLDLRALRVGRLSIEAGAGAVDARLGTEADYIDILIEGGATDVRLTVPEDVGIRIEWISGLAGSNFEAAGLVERQPGIHESPGYADAKKRASIRLATGISSIRLVRQAQTQ